MLRIKLSFPAIDHSTFETRTRTTSRRNKLLASAITSYDLVFFSDGMFAVQKLHTRDNYYAIAEYDADMLETGLQNVSGMDETLAIINNRTNSTKAIGMIRR